MKSLTFRDVDALCVRRRKYVSDDFPWFGYGAAFRRHVNGVLRERKIELRDMPVADYFASCYEDGAFAERVAATFSDVFSLDCMFLDPKDEIAALLYGRSEQFEAVDFCMEIRRMFGVDVTDLLLDRASTFGQLVDFLAHQTCNR